MARKKEKEQQPKTWQWWIEKVIMPILLALITGYFLLITSGIVKNPFSPEVMPSATSTAQVTSTSESDVDVPIVPSLENELSPAVQVMEQYYKYINNANVSNDLSRAWDLLTQKLQCNSADQCNLESYRTFWWGQQVHYKLYDCESNVVDTELIYYARGSEPTIGKKPVYLRYTLIEDNGQLKLNSGEFVDRNSAYCDLAVTYP